MTRLAFIDRWRGGTLLMMIAFHFCYDLTLFGYARFRLLDDPFWIDWRILIVGSFAFISGLSLSLGRFGSRRPPLGRLAQLGGAAALVSIVTALLFGSRWIYFGVLHFFFLATLVTRPLLRVPGWLGVAGIGLVLLGWVGFDAMNPRYLNWIGLASQKPLTEDYAPLIPWLGVLWLGVFMGSRIRRPTVGTRTTDPLQWMGRHSLAIYLGHQPILFVLLGLFTLVLRGQGALGGILF